MERKEFFLKLKDWMPILFLLFGVISLAYTSSIRNNYYAILSLDVSLLAFVAIFYPLVIQKRIKESKEKLIVSYRTKFVANVSESLKKINNYSENDYNSVSDEIGKIREESDNLTIFHEQINLKKILFRIIASFLISIFLLLGDLIFTPNPLILQDLTVYFLSQPGFILFLYGFYKTIMLIYSWNEIVSKI
ncbi:Uncharacterised protein [uncultured archaeon]|nr:Uncharacterised protein [uncultured archaeon]